MSPPDPSRPWALYLMGRGEKKLERLTPGVSAYDYDPAFSDDGSAIAFARTKDGETEDPFVCVLIRK